MKSIFKICIVFLFVFTLFGCNSKEEEIEPIIEENKEQSVVIVDEEDKEPITKIIEEKLIPIMDVNNEGNNKYSCDYNGQTRTFFLYPSSAGETKGIIIIFHGYKSDAESFEDGIKFELLANPKGYAVFYVDGLKDPTDPNSFTGWNVGINPKNPIDDFGFIKSFVAYLQNFYQLTRNETFMVGFSAGGIISYQMVIEAENYVGAIASVCGRVTKNIWDKREEKPNASILQISGTNDPVVPLREHGKESFTNDPFIEDVIDYYADSQELCHKETIELSDCSTLYKNYGDKTSNQVWHILVENGAHGWYNMMFGGFDTTKIIMDFFDEVSK